MVPAFSISRFSNLFHFPVTDFCQISLLRELIEEALGWIIPKSRWDMEVCAELGQAHCDGLIIINSIIDFIKQLLDNKSEMFALNNRPLLFITPCKNNNLEI